MGYEREDGEVTEDEEEAVLSNEVAVQVQLPTYKLPDVNDLRLAVFRSVVERKMAEKSLNSEGTGKFPPKKKCKATTKEINPPSQLSGGSSSDMEVEMWDSTEAEASSMNNLVSEIRSDETSQSVLKPDIRQSDELLRADVCSSVSITVASDGVSLVLPACPPKGASDSVTGDGLSINAVFHFKEGELLDSFGLGLQERKHKKHKGSFDSNATSAESQKLAAIFSYWHMKGNKGESPSFSCSDERGDAAGLLTGPSVGISPDGRLLANSIERQSANPSMKRTGSTVSMTSSIGTAGSATAGVAAGTANGARATAAKAKGGADGKKEAANILSSSILKVTSNLSAAQQRSKIEEDIARLKVEILMRERKAKHVNVQPSLKPLPLPAAGREGMRAPVQKTSLSPLAVRVPTPLPVAAPAPVVVVEGRPSAVTVGAKIPIASCLLPMLDTITTPAPSSMMMSGLLDEHLLRAAALISRKKKQKDKPPNSASTGGSPGLAVSLAAFVPVPPSAPLPATPVRRVKTYPSSRCNLAFSGGRTFLLTAPPVNNIEALKEQEHILMKCTDPSILAPFPSHSGSTGVDGWGQGWGQGGGWGPADMRNEPGNRTQGPTPSYSHPNGATSTLTVTPRNIKSSSRLADPLEEGEEVEECVEMARDGFNERWRALRPHPPFTINNSNSNHNGDSNRSSSSNNNSNSSGSSSSSNRKRDIKNNNNNNNSSSSNSCSSVGAKYVKSLAVGGQYSHATGLVCSPHHTPYRHRTPIRPNNGQAVNSQISVRESTTSLLPSNMDIDVDMDVDVDMEMDVNMEVDVGVDSSNGVQAKGAPVSTVKHPPNNTDTTTITIASPPLALHSPTYSPTHLPADLIQRLKLLKKQRQLRSKKKVSTYSVADADLNAGVEVEYLDNEYEECTVEGPVPATVQVPAKVKDSSSHTFASVPSCVPSIAPILSNHTHSNHIHSDHIHSNGKSSAADIPSSNPIAAHGSRALAEEADILYSDSSVFPLNNTIDPTVLNISSDKKDSDNISTDNIGPDCVTAPCTAMHKDRSDESDVLSHIASGEGDEEILHTHALPLPLSLQPFTDTPIKLALPSVPMSISDHSTATKSSCNPSLPTTTSGLTAGTSIDTTPHSLIQHPTPVPTVHKATAQSLLLREAELKVTFLLLFILSVCP